MPAKVQVSGAFTAGFGGKPVNMHLFRYEHPSQKRFPEK
jgi:hypothetical protein